MDSTVNKTEYWSNKNTTGKPGGPNKQPKHKAPTPSSIDKLPKGSNEKTQKHKKHKAQKHK